MPGDVDHIERIAGLIIKYQQENLSDSEHRQLLDWCDLSADNLQVFNKLSNPTYKDKIDELTDIHAFKEADWEKVVAIIAAESHTISITPGKQMNWMFYLVAVFLAGLFIIGSGFQIKYASNNTSPQPSTSHFKNDIEPGGNKAALTLSN